MQISETKISCPRCNLVNSDDTKFCSKCGHEFNKKHSKTFWKWILILLSCYLLAIVFPPLFFLYFILVSVFANTIYKILKITGIKRGWLLGGLAMALIVGPLIPFIAARHKLKKSGNWDNNVKPEPDQTPLPPNISPKPKRSKKLPIFVIITIITIVIIIIIIISGGGTRNCIKRLTGGFLGEGPIPPECSDYDRKLKDTTLNGRLLGKCIALSDYGECIR